MSVNRPGPSYTVETLESLRAESAARPLGLIVGMDAFIAIDSWHRSQDILSLAHIIVAHRPGAKLPESGHAGELLAANRVNAIRSAARAGESQRYLVPDAVATLIETSGCYAA